MEDAIYQDGYNVRVGDPVIDRARGGILKITLKIPSQTYTANGACSGTYKTKAMTLEVEIDIEKLPLVNTAGYKIEEQQTDPDTIPYPPKALSFSFS
jgi:hypothetical protein